MRSLAVVAVVAVAALAASPEPSPAELAYRAELARATSTLRVPFDTGEASLSPAALALLEPLVPVLARAPSPVEVAGHADGAGDAAANRALSLRRAEAVKAALVVRGVPAGLLVVRGYGADQPLASNLSAAGRAQNRRIGFHLAAEGPAPDALLTSVQPRVQARPARVPEWVPAAVGQPLYRLDEVATAERASAELTFKDQSVLRLREKSMAIVLGDEATRRGGGKGTVELVRGEGHLSLAELRSTALTVDTPAATVAARSRALVIDVDPSQMSRVSVHQGSAQVAAAGATVKVRQGEGTRVARGQVPEPPQPLPAAPEWMGSAEVARAARPGGLEVGLQVKPVPGAARYRLEVAADQAFNVLLQVHDAEGPEARVTGLGPGTYHVRASARDARGLLGPPSSLLTLSVVDLPVPATATAPWTPPAPAAPGFSLTVDGAAPSGPVPPGHHRLALVSTAGVEQEAWEVEVAAPAPVAEPVHEEPTHPAAPGVPSPRLEGQLPSRQPGRWGAPAAAAAPGPELAVAVDLWTFSHPEVALTLTAEAPWGEGGAVRLRALGALPLGGAAPTPAFELGAQVVKRVLGGPQGGLSLVGDGALQAVTGTAALRAFAVADVALGPVDLSTAHGAGAALAAAARPFYLGNAVASLRLAGDTRLTLEGDLQLGPTAPAAVGVGAGLQVAQPGGELGLGLRVGLTPAGQDAWGLLAATASWRFR